MDDTDTDDFSDGFGRWSDQEADRVREWRKRGEQKRKRRMRERNDAD